MLVLPHEGSISFVPDTLQIDWKGVPTRIRDGYEVAELEVQWCKLWVSAVGF